MTDAPKDSQVAQVQVDKLEKAKQDLQEEIDDLEKKKQRLERQQELGKEHSKLADRNKELVNQNRRLHLNIDSYWCRFWFVVIFFVITAGAFIVLGIFLFLKPIHWHQLIGVLVLCLLWSGLFLSAGWFTSRLR